MRSSVPFVCRRLVLAGFLVASAGRPLAAQQGASTAPAANDPTAQLRALLGNESYVRPPEVIERLVTAPRHLNVSLSQPSPDRRHFLKQQSEGLPSVAAFGKPHLYFAGLQVDPAANRARSLTTRGAAGLELIDATTGRSTTIETPKNATVSSPAWSPDGRRLAYIANFETASHIYVADVATGKSTQLTRTPLLAIMVSTVDWSGDGRSVVAVLLPENRKPEPKRPPVAAGPQVRVWMDGRTSPQRNYWSLLEDPFDQELMEWFVTGQLALIDVRSRAVKRIGTPAMIRSVDVGPEGRFFRVTTMRKPFSYVVPYNAFGTTEEIWDADGKILAEVAKRDLREAQDTTDGGGFGRGGGDGPKRGLAWMPDGQGMYYIEAQPGARRDSGDAPAAGTGRAGGAGRGGAAGGGGNRPDRVVRWNPPFGPNDTTVLYRHNGPLGGVLFTDDAQMLFASATSGGQGELFAVRLAEPARRFTILRQRAWNGGLGGGGGRGGGRAGGGADDSLSFYANPGNLMTRRGTRGGPVVMLSSDSAVFLQGTRYFPDYVENAPREFIDKVVIATGQKTNLFTGAADAYENVTAALDDDLNRVIVTRESPKQVPDSWLRDMKTGQLTKLTNNRDYAPEFTNAIRKRITVARPDGIRFVTNVTLPSDWREGTRLPALFWFYPYEYTSQAEYDRTLRNYNANRFPTGGTRTMEYLTTQGYAVVNFNPPIMGEQGRMNDNYVADLRMNLYAVIDELDRQGIIDRQRLGIGGHSYGAFSTANALVHTPFFKAGIAGDGMYNRTLTPNGFQSERRDLWDGQQTYLEMSPMLYVDQMQGALLLYHGMEDQNVGTHLISSIRMMQALRAHGKTSALYMYPYEDHGPATKESLLDLWGRWTAWLDLYVKNAGKPARAAVQ
ncbi:MAG TPA: prolyl oligopeptidase family serine peptidase [Gemmatimonadaceae bacterium]|nr:prolyl oligopeptidase family serine peptidase [Gemmatimonadaceae bacterium]